MKRLLTFLFVGAFVIALNSCTEDYVDRSNSSAYFMPSEGRLLVVATDNIVGDQFVHASYEVFLEDTVTKLVTPVNVSSTDIDEFIPLSGNYVHIDSEIPEGSTLKSRFVRTVDDHQLKGKGGGKGNNGDKGGGGGAKVLLVMVSDPNSTPNCTGIDMEYELIGADNPESAANFFTVSSKGKFTISSVTTIDVFINSIACSVTSLSRTVDAELKSMGVSTKGYNHIMYVTANVCGYGGQAVLNGNIVHNAYCMWEVVSPHELGHNIGMHHSTRTNADGTVSAYGDPSCFMATASSELNVPHRIEMGWLSKKSQTAVRTPGTYLLSPLELDNTPEKQALILDIGMVNFNRPEKYYLSYRAPVGPLDNNISPSVANKLSIHTWSGEKSWVTRYVTAIGEGEEFVDAENGLHITVTSLINEVMEVVVSF